MATIIVLNGAPRSGKSSIAAQIIAVSPGRWVNVGVDSIMAATPQEMLPGVGLRPGGEHPELEAFVLEQYRALFGEVANQARSGVNVVMDVGIHDDYSTPLGLAEEMAQAFAEIETVRVGVHCSLDVLRDRREESGYLSWPPGGEVPEPVRRWQRAVHLELAYDITVDTSASSSLECARAIRAAVLR